MKKFVIRVHCACYEDIEMIAETEEEAIEQALIEYNCAGNQPEFEETISKEELTLTEEG